MLGNGNVRSGRNASRWLAPLLVLGLFGFGGSGVWAESQRFVVNRIVVEGEHPIPESEIQEMVSPYLGEQDGFLDLRNAAQVIEEALQKRGLPFHRVIIPAQRTTSGTIRFEVIAFKLDQVQVEGNEHFTSRNVRAMVPALRPEQTPDPRELARALQLANTHPVKQVGLTVKRSQKPRHINAVINVRDQSPHQLFASLANRGSEDTGDQRLSVGYQYSNLFNRDHSVTMSYTTSPGHWDDVQQYGLNYVMPLYGIAGELSAFYTSSDVDSGVIAQFFDVSGSGEFYGLRYTQFLPQIGDFRHRIRVSVEDRKFDSDTTFFSPTTNVGTPIGTDVRSQPVGVEYIAEIVRPNANYVFNVSYNINAFFSSDNTEAAYGGTGTGDGSRVGADKNWDVIRFGASVDYKFPNAWLFRGRFTGQRSGEPLIPGEQFGLGGADSIRGFDEREVAGDDGYHLSLEAWAPPNKTGIQMLAFADGGYGYRWETAPGDAEALTLTSFGVGARWSPTRRLSMSADFAYVTNGAGNVESGSSKFHFTVLARL